MKANLAKYFTAILAMAVLFTAAEPLKAGAAQTGPASSAPAKYPLTKEIQAEIKSVWNEKTAAGRTIGAVVRLHNQTSQIIRIPEYEVSVRAGDNTEYALQPSAGNAIAIQPKSKAELSYRIVLDRDDEISLSAVMWTEFNEKVYPRKGKRILTVPLASNKPQTRAWGESFAIPEIAPSLVYTPLSLIQQYTRDGLAALAIFEAENTGALRAFIPDLTIQAKSGSRTFTGKPIGQSGLVLEPGDKRQVFFSIPLENDTELIRLLVSTPESFMESGQPAVRYQVVRAEIALPAGLNAAGVGLSAPRYEWRKPIPFPENSRLGNTNVDVSMVELRLLDTESGGFKSAVAKFKLENRGRNAVPIPDFSIQLTDKEGRQYAGKRLEVSEEKLMPNLGYVVGYAVGMPESVQGDLLTLSIMDNLTADPFEIPVKDFQTEVRNESEGSLLTLYPFEVKLKDWTMTTDYQSGTYTFRLKLNLELERESNVLVDQNFSRMKVELIDTDGSVIACESLPFIGENRLIDGWQTIDFGGASADQWHYPYTIKIYEAIETPNGEAVRLVKTLKQK